MTKYPTSFRLIREAPPRATAALIALMLLSRLTESAGILMLVPILDSLRGSNETAGLSFWIGELLGRAGLSRSLEWLLLLFVLLVALRSLLVFAQQTQSIRYQSLVIDRLREKCFSQLLTAEWRWLSEGRSSDHANVLTNGIGRIGLGLNHLIGLGASLATMATYVAVALLLSWPITLFAAFVGACAHVLLARHRRQAVLLGVELGSASRAVQANVQQGLAGIRLSKILRNEERHLAQFSAVIATMREQQLRFARKSNLALLLVQTGGAALLATLVYMGVKWWVMPMSTLLTIVLVFGRLVPLFASIQQSWHHWLHAVPAIADLDHVLAQSANAREPLAGEDCTPFALDDAIEIDGLTLTYAGRDRPALDSVSLRIRARETTAIIGPSGSGKSSLADVLMALIEPDGGKMTVDGIEVSGANRHRMRRTISYVQQDAFLFSDTIRWNLLWSNPHASDAAINQALSAASADFVHALPKGLDTHVGDGGVRLSGGERQRIALARALLGQPGLLILDEATSALDPGNEAIVRQAIRTLHGSMTIVLIGHRLAKIDSADQVIELRDGKLVSASSMGSTSAACAA